MTNEDFDDDEDESNIEHGIYRVKYTLVAGNERRVTQSDFILKDDQLLLVLEWVHRPEGDMWPGFTLPLEDDLLDEDPNRPGYYIYSGEIVDPRKRS
jgi:hypothetical protein